MRKMLSLLVALAMVLGVVGTTAFAEDVQVVDTINLYMPSVPAVGELLCDVESVELEEGAPYTIEEISWYGWEVGSGDELDLSAPCTAPGCYSLQLKLVPAEGYRFAEYCSLVVNGEEKGYYYHDGMDEALYCSADWDIFYESVGEVFLYLNGDEIGADVDDVEVTCNNSELVSVDEVVFEIYDYETDSYLPYDGIIEDNSLIRVVVRLSCVGERSFRDASVIINDEYVELSSESATAEAYYYIANLEGVVTVQVDNATAPEAGAMPTVDGLTVPEDAPYEIVGAYWMNGETYELQEEAFEDKCAYYLMVDLRTDDGYMFLDETEAFLDGEFTSSWHSGNNMLTIQKRFSLKDKITKVEITDLDKPVAGQTPDDEITVSEGADREVYIRWYDWNTGDEITSFAEKGFYEVAITLLADDGLEFAEDVTVTINGQQLQCGSDGDYLYIYKTYSIGYEAIDAFEITIDQIEAGQSPEDVKVQVSDDLQIEEMAWAVSEDGNLEDAEILEGKFEDGATYFFAAWITVPEGKVFGDDLKIKINGNEVKADYMEYYFDTALVYYGPITTDGEGLTPPAVTPPTGEMDLLTPMAVLAMLSGAGIVVMMMLKKRRYY